MVRKNQQLQIPSSFLKGILAGLVTTVLIAIITASLISVDTIGEDAADIGAMVALLLSSVISALVAGGKAEKMRLIMCIAGASAYFLMLLCGAAILFDGVRGGIFPSALLTLGGGLTAGLLGLNKDKRRHYKVPKLRS